VLYSDEFSVVLFAKNPRAGACRGKASVSFPAGVYPFPRPPFHRLLYYQDIGFPSFSAMLYQRNTTRLQGELKLRLMRSILKGTMSTLLWTQGTRRTRCFTENLARIS